MEESNKGKCPVMHRANTETENNVMDWWPKALNLDILHQHDSKTDPHGKEYNYAEEFKSEEKLFSFLDFLYCFLSRKNDRQNIMLNTTCV